MNYAFSRLLPDFGRHECLQNWLLLLQFIKDVLVGVILRLNVDQLAKIIVNSGLILSELKLHDTERTLVWL